MNPFQTFSKLRRFLLVLVLIFFMGTAVRYAHALQCGDTITKDTKLTADLGPCTSGLAIDAEAQKVTLDLNGHTISGTDTGILIEGTNDVTIKGPGRIANFSTGISIGPLSSNQVLIYNLVFTGNQTGIAVTAAEGSIRALQNIIVGRKKQGSGILLAVTSNVYIYQNTIKDYAEAVSIEGEVQNAVVDENLIIRNQTGISVSSPDNSCSTIRGNRVKFNDGNGIEAAGPTSVFLHTAASFTCPGVGSDIEDNTVSFNRGSGIVAGAGLAGTRLVQDNLVSFNKIDGISVIGTDITETPGPVQVIGNYVVRNGTDLVWDGVGTGNCWQQNIFGTSSPQVLPACQ